ncbi:putative adaptor gamma-1 chain [Leptomonas seymouri]|uniref:AP-1 complex subunit gamma n=1 Tax=Leptomonas seymouri TaxID=5684 RepID=A0A0N0P707_LEPSE|nr:putative adaptor gamma-1 chain [Leptomonas seymouri]|eukprot:KPI88229.1 putative adaptor gamma-1 chain [Leptomonas seymouri]
MSSMDSLRLQGLIRMIRRCKTVEEERSSVKIACSQLRKGFEEATPYLRVRYMLMLLYIRMLGYPTEFGHMEVLNLLSQSDFSGVRTGYLALQLLFSENDEVLTLAENRMIAHLSICGARHGVSYEQLCLVGVSLNAVANIVNEDMCRDLLDPILRLFQNSPYQLRNKAALAALRVACKAPDQAGYILEHCTDLFDASTESLMCVLTLVIACLQTESGSAMMPQFRRLAMSAVRTLKGLVLSSRITDEDVGGITNPFLQIKLLHFMRLIGTGSEVTSEALNDVLAQVITNTDATRNVGCSVLYECVRTINAIESDEGLRALAVNTIGRFVSSVKDNNLRFVALETLLACAKRDFNAVLQHQMIILECLRDPDLTIRRRAMDLTVTLVTVNNVRLLVPDLITYMTLCAEEMKADVVRHICDVIEGHYPTDEWRVDFSLRLLKVAKQHAPIDFASRLIAVISNQPDEVKSRAVQSLWEEASYPFDALHQSRKSFLMVALWCIGEYVELLLSAVKGLKGVNVATCLSNITTNTNYTVIKQYGLTALMKVATKIPDAKEQALSTFASSMTSMDCELQQRACEYTTMLSDFPQEAIFSFGRMPAIRPETDAVKPVDVVSLTQEQLHQETANTLDNLFNFDGASKPQPSSSYTASMSPASPLQLGYSERLSSSVADHQHEQDKPTSRFVNAVDDLFGGGLALTSDSPLVGGPPSNPAIPEAKAKTISGVPLCTCADFTVLLSGRMDGTHIKAGLEVQSGIGVAIEQLSFSVAALRMCTVEVAPLPSVIPPFGTATQQLVVDNTLNTAHPHTLTLRVKVSYAVSGELREQMFQVSQEM